jgi:putative transposase
MDQQSIRKTYKYQLVPTSEQERTLATVVWRYRELYNAGLQERKAAWETCGVCVSFAMQSAQLPAIKQVRPEYNEINAQVLQDVLHRLDRAFAAFFRRVKIGERPGYPRFQSADRYTSFTSPQVGEHGGAALDGGMLSLSKIGRMPIRLHRGACHSVRVGIHYRALGVQRPDHIVWFWIGAHADYGKLVPRL